MYQLRILASALFIFLSLNTSAQNSNSKLEMEQKVTKIESTINNYLSDKTGKVQFNEIMMNEEDLNFWFDQFIFNEEVLAQTSKEEFYNKIESWAISAKTNFTKAIAEADKIEVGGSTFQFGEDPTMNVNKSANVTIYILKNKSIVNQMQLTFIDVKGKLKLIQAV